MFDFRKLAEIFGISYTASVSFGDNADNPKMGTAWGKELLVDFKNSDAGKVQSGEVIQAFFDELVTAIDMVKFGPLMLEHFANHDPAKGGYTAIQMIETSAISGHFVDATNDGYLNVFSCKEFDVKTVLDLVQKHFNPDVISYETVIRDAEHSGLDNFTTVHRVSTH